MFFQIRCDVYDRESTLAIASKLHPKLDGYLPHMVNWVSGLIGEGGGQQFKSQSRHVSIREGINQITQKKVF